MGIVITLLIAGAVLLALETILPGLVAGIAGVGCLIGAVVASYVHFGVTGGNIALVGVAIGLIIGTLIWMHYLPHSRLSRLFVSYQAIGNIDAERPELLGQTGTALTQLRPSGTALINDRRVDVVTEGVLLDPGTPLKVVAIEGMRVVVRAVDLPTETTNKSSEKL